MAFYTSAGAIVAIGTNAADPLTDTYTDIAEIVGVPNFGKEYNVVEHRPLADRQIKKVKGSYNEGSNIEMNLARDLKDPGQIAAEAALDSDDVYNISITLNDDPNDGTASAPSVIYLPSLIVAFPINLNDVDSVIGGLIRLEVTRPIQIVPWVSGT